MKSKLAKGLAFVLVLATVLATVFSTTIWSVPFIVHAQDIGDDLELKTTYFLNNGSLEASGLTLTSQDFAQHFFGEPTNRLLPRSLMNTSISLSNIFIDERDIAIDMTIGSGEHTVSIPVVGRLYASNSTQMGVNSMVVDVLKSVEGFDILLFEIHNDYAAGLFDPFTTRLTRDASLSARPHVKIYIQGPSGEIYLFEIDLPHEFSHLNAFSMPLVSGGMDINWRLQFVEPEVREIPLTRESMESLDVNAILSSHGIPIEDTVISWHNPEQGMMYLDQNVVDFSHIIIDDSEDLISLDTLSFEATSWSNSWVTFLGQHQFLTPNWSSQHGHHYIHTLATAFVWVRVADVYTQDTTWIAEFYITENSVHSVTGQVFTGLDQIRVWNLDMRFAAGGNTNFSRTFYGGIVTANNVPRPNNVTNVLMNTVDLAGDFMPIPTSTINTVISLLNRSSVQGSQNVNIGSQGTIVHGRGSQVAGQRLSNHSLSTNNHKFTMNTVVFRPANQTGWTHGVLRVSFCWFVNRTPHVWSSSIPPADITFPYRVN